MKTVHFKETLVSGNFLPWLSAILYVYVFAELYLLQDCESELFCNDGGGDPLHLLLEGALGQ